MELETRLVLVMWSHCVEVKSITASVEKKMKKVKKWLSGSKPQQFSKASKS